MLTDIILIGPYGAGKSTLAELLAERLNWHQYPLDDERHRYLKEMEGYNIDIANQMTEWELSSPKWQRYNIYLVERFLDEHANSDENCVLDLGAGHSVYKDIRFRSRAKQIFAPYPNVVLILPSKNVEESLELLLNQVRNHGLNMTFDRCRVNRIIELWVCSTLQDVVARQGITTTGGIILLDY